MKGKKVFIGGAVLAISIVSAISVNVSLNTPNNDFMITNIEVLAQGEGGGSGCAGTGTVVCNGQAIYYGKYY